MSDDSDTLSPRTGTWFDTTQWSLVLAAGDREHPAQREALATLCKDYWSPIYAYIRRLGHDADSSRDLTQGFFARLLEKDYLASARQERGRFRSFLLASVKHYLSHERDRERAQKRGGGVVPLPLDRETAERQYQRIRSKDAGPDRIFEKRWAVAILEKALTLLRQEMERDGQAERFRQLSGTLTGETIEGGYRQAAEALELSEQTIKVAVHRMRRRFSGLVREEVERTVDDPSEVDEEIRYLFSTIRA
jgi:RNA polymerase sigma-70 factor (ECF subfamily)